MGVDVPGDLFWLWLDRGSIVLSYVTLATVVSGAVYVLRFAFDHRRRRRQLQTRAIGQTIRPMALAISFGGGSIQEAVKDYLGARYPHTQIPVREYVEQTMVTPNNVYLHLQKIRALKNELQSQGVTELHLFYKGPVTLPFALGAIFDNWASVKVYHNQKANEGYQEWFTLESAKVQPAIRTVAEQVAAALETKESGKKSEPRPMA